MAPLDFLSFAQDAEVVEKILTHQDAKAVEPEARRWLADEKTAYPFYKRTRPASAITRGLL
jgi:hypothetical protein